MLRDFGYDEYLELESALEHLEILKMLERNGYKFSDIHLWSFGDIYYSKENFGNEIFELLCGPEHVEIELASNERGKIKGYELFVDPEEYSFYEITVNSSDIMEYLTWCKDYGYKFDELPEEFMEYVNDLTANTGNCYNDYEEYDSWVAEDFSGIVLLVSDYEFVNMEFVSTLVQMLDFCKIQNKNRKGNDENVNTCSIAA